MESIPLATLAKAAAFVAGAVTAARGGSAETVLRLAPRHVDHVELTASDGVAYASATCPGVWMGGPISIGAKPFAAFLRRLVGEHVQLTIGEKLLSVQSQDAKGEFPFVRPYQGRPELSASVWRCQDPDWLARAFARAQSCLEGEDEHAPILSGVRVARTGERLSIVGTTGYRLGCSARIEPGPSFEAVIPGRYVRALIALAEGAGDEIQLSLATSGAGWSLLDGSRRIDLPLMAGTYPAVDHLLERGDWLPARFERGRLERALQTISAVGGPRDLKVNVTLGQDGIAVLRAVDTAGGMLRLEASLPCIWPSAARSVSFYAHDIELGLRHLYGDQVSAWIPAEEGPVRLTGEAPDREAIIIMPVQA